jgi:inorganic pyrophosphatase
MIRWIRLIQLTHFVFALQLHERLCLVVKRDIRYLSSMYASLYDLDPGPQSPEVVRMIVEIPKNSANKYEYDGKLGVFRLDRALYSPMHYPGDYGFVPGTLAEDGDPLDVLVTADEPTFAGCMIEVRPVGLLEMVDEHGPDQKILAMPDRNPRYDQIHTIDQVFPHVRREIEHFFEIYKELEGKKTQMKGWKGPKEARHAVVESRDRYLQMKAAQKSGASPA